MYTDISKNGRVWQLSVSIVQANLVLCVVDSAKGSDETKGLYFDIISTIQRQIQRGAEAAAPYYNSLTLIDKI